MANEESGSPLRRWRAFYGAFSAIDDAIEAAGHPRAAFRDVRVRILQLLRGATDDGVAEQLCAALDEPWRSVRVAPVPHSALASTDLARAVGALGNHGSARIRGLARDVVRGWTVAIDGGATAVKEELDKLSGDQIPHQSISTVIARSVVHAAAAEAHEMKLHVPPAKLLPAATVAATEERKKKLSVPPPMTFTTAALVSGRQETSEPKKPVVAQSKKLEIKKPLIAQSEKMETTKRKLREGYDEAEKFKRQHTIQKINDKEAPKLLERSQRKMHRGPARCRTSSSVRRSLLPSLQLI